MTSNSKHLAFWFYLGKILAASILALVIGCGLFFSYYMEKKFAESLFAGQNTILIGSLTIPMLLAGLCNLGKLSIAGVLVFSDMTGKSAIKARAVYVALITYSLLVTCVISSALITAPNLDKVFKKQRYNLESQLRKQVSLLKQNLATELAQEDKVYQEQKEDQASLFKGDLDEARKGMNFERSNEVHGIWQGSKYKEWAKKYASAQAQLVDIQTALAKEHRTRVQTINEKYADLLERKQIENQALINGLEKESFLENHDSQNPFFAFFLHLTRQFEVSKNIRTAELILVVSVLIMFIIEFLPITLALFSFQYIFTALGVSKVIGNRLCGK